MSHFVTIILVSKEEDVLPEALVAERLAPYDEGREGPERKVYLNEKNISDMKECYKWEDPKDSDIIDKIRDYFGCEGGGKDENGFYYLTTYNVNSKWDWWRVGGRWDGWIQGKDEALAGKDGFNFGGDHEKFENNVSTVAVLLERIKERGMAAAPFAMVDLKGEWHERGKMGWWGMVANRKEEDAWCDEVIAYLESIDGETYAVACDLHI